jgi:hypothetical protein
VLREWREHSRNKADFIVPMSWRTPAWTQHGQPFHLADHLANFPIPPGRTKFTCSPRPAGKRRHCRLRLVIVRKSPQAAETARLRLKSRLLIDQIPTRCAPASRSWRLAHLAPALLCDDLTQDFLESSP